MMMVGMMSGKDDRQATSAITGVVVARAVVIVAIAVGRVGSEITRTVEAESEGVEPMPVAVRVVMPVRPVMTTPRGRRRCESQAQGRDDCGNCKFLCRFHIY